MTETRWSRKGREVKVYGLANKVVIIAPPVSDLRSVLQKYAALFGIVVLATVGLAGLLQVLMPLSGEAAAPAAETGGGGILKAASFDAREAAAGVPAVHDLVMGFFFGACLVLLGLMLYELHYWWRSSPRVRSRDRRT